MDATIIVIVISLLFSAFFSGMEIAFVSANKIHIEIEKKQDNFMARVLALLTKRPSKFIATMLIGNNIALVVYGLFMGDLLMELFSGWQTSSIGFVRLVFTEFSLIT
ncbi:MAG: CNNM domain-containing protein, partial [Arenibacter sp.]|nr:CNNM domain-containing protein [Arenibacter sp.]